MEAGNFKDALSLLEKSLKMNKQVMGEEHHSNCLIFIAMSHVHQRLKDYDNAINLLFQVWELYQQIFGSTSLEVASSYLELAQANLKKKDFNEAINFQQKALKVFSEVDQQTVSQDMVADTAITLSEWLEKVERIEEALDVLKQAE
jgi:tetratricopeptide (TPR) repeat protein